MSEAFIDLDNSQYKSLVNVKSNLSMVFCTSIVQGQMNLREVQKSVAEMPLFYCIIFVYLLLYDLGAEEDHTTADHTTDHVGKMSFALN